MKNIPRIFVGDNINTGIKIPLSREILHYLTRVMRTRECLVFGGGNEFVATVSDDDKNLVVGDKTPHIDPSNDITLMFSPIKHTDDLINMATQMGIARFIPVKFDDLDLSDIVFADERAAYGADVSTDFNTTKILVGPEGGFSDDEFNALDAAHARGVSLGKTILRAETAAIVALAKIIK